MSINKANQEGYSVGSGAYSVINSDLKMYLDAFGNFQAEYSNEDALQQAEAVCCMSNNVDNETTISQKLYGNDKNIKYDQFVGYYHELYAGYVAEGDYRENGSSGGLTTWILVELLNNGIIDGVIHVKTSNVNQMLFEYAISRTTEEIKQGSKSRYYPAEYSKVINEIKSGNERFAIVGIPSFIMELRLLQNKIPELKDKIKYTIGLVCGHQKSTKYAECIAWQFGIKPGKLKYIDFRKKLLSAPANEYITEIVGEIDGQEVRYIKNQHEIFVSNWGHGFFKRKFSDFSDDAFNETADIVLGDAWLPEYMHDSLGNNIVIVRNRELADLVAEAIINNRLKLDQISADIIVKSQSGLVRHMCNEIDYRLYKKDKQNKWRPTKRVQAGKKIPFLRRKIQDTRCQISELSHLKYKEAVDKGDFNYFTKTMKPYLFKYQVWFLINIIFDKGPVWFLKKSYKKIMKKI